MGSIYSGVTALERLSGAACAFSGSSRPGGLLHVSGRGNGVSGAFACVRVRSSVFAYFHHFCKRLKTDGGSVAADAIRPGSTIRTLEIKEPHRSIKGLDEDEKGRRSMTTPGGEQELTIINEPGLYRLVFKSRKKEAQAFKRWVCHEVLPSIRKNGAYFAPNIPLEKLQKLMESVGEQYKMLIENNSILRQQLEYAMQFVPKSKYGSTSPVNGQRRTTIRRGANVAGKGRLIERRDPSGLGNNARHCRPGQSGVQNGEPRSSRGTAEGTDRLSQTRMRR